MKVIGSGDCGYVVGDFNMIEDYPRGHVKFRGRLHATVVKTRGEWRITTMSFSR